MRIILTIDYSPWSAYGGGAQRSTHNLATTLARRGHDVSVVFTKPPWERVSIPAAIAYDLRWATLLALRSRRNAPLRPLSAFSVAGVVRNLLNGNAATIVHSNGEEGGMIGTLRRKHRFGFVSTPRHPRYPPALLNGRPLGTVEWLRLAVFDGKYLMQRRAARSADVVSPPSAWAAELVGRAFGIDPDRLRPVPNGVPDEFLKYTWECRLDGPLVFFGRFDQTKGVDTLIDALGLLGAEGPRTMIIGRGADRGAVKRRVGDVGLDSRVEFHDWMTHDELGDVLSAASMVVLPSREENFSLGVLAAMAVGAPVISTRVGGTPEIVTDGETGLLVPPDDPHGLAQAILSLRHDNTFSRRIADAGRAHVRSTLTWDQAARRFEEIYESIANVNSRAWTR